MQNNMAPQSNAVEVIWSPIPRQVLGSGVILPRKLRLAAYCRVSSELDSQVGSLKFQEAYYRSMILTNPEWQLVGVFCDEGITGTRSDARPEFQRMMRLALEGKIDKIITKSVSRFGRNIADFLDAIRMLKSNNIGVIFQREGIDTSSESSEFLLSTLAAISQEESRSTSENILWSFSKRFQNGVPAIRRILGYNVTGSGSNLAISINDKEAQVVKEVYRLALEGTGYKDIAQYLMDNGIKTSRGKTDWSANSVKEILKNERYTGSAICQKTFTHNHLSHKRAQNLGQRTRYVIENHHAAIIDHHTFDRVREILRKKQFTKARPRTKYPLSGCVICGSCGSKYNHYATAEPSWRCSRNLKSVKLCGSPRITESQFAVIMKTALTQRYGFSDRRLIMILGKDLEWAHSEQAASQLSRMKFELQDLLLKSIHKDGTEIHNHKSLEAQYEAQCMQVKNLDRDRKYRVNALKWLDHLPRGGDRNKWIQNNLTIEYMRAWVMSVKVLSPILFEIVWFDGSTSTVSL